MNKNELPKLQPVPILLTTYNRVNFLEKTIEYINERTRFPYRIIVGDNGSTDGTVGYLKTAKVRGKIFDHLFLPENVGQSRLLNKLFWLMEDWEENRRRPHHRYFCTTNDDLYPPMLGGNCWLSRMIDLLERNEPEYGGICGRIQRTPRTDIREDLEITPLYKNFPSVYRLMIRNDFRQLGDRPFGRLLKWDSNTCSDKFKLQLKKKFGLTTHIYFDHAGFQTENKGYGKDVETLTVAENKVNEHLDKPYPDIHPLTNVPVKINHPCDRVEQELRDNADKKPEVTVIILTCHRYDGLKRIIESVKDKTKDVDYDLLVVADDDDTEAYNYCIGNDIECILASRQREFTAQANLGVYACQTPYFVILGDDSEIIDPEWLKRAVEVYKEKFPDDLGLLSFNDGINGGRIFAMGMSSKKYVREIGGHLYFPGFLHYAGDREAKYLAQRLGHWHHEDSIKIAHHHHSQTGEKDAVYTRSERHWHKDRVLRRERDENLVNIRNIYDYRHNTPDVQSSGEVKRDSRRVI